MRYSLVTTAALCLGLMAGTSAATAQEVTEASCRTMDAQVQSALEGNAQAASHDQALQERNSARQYCARGFYKMGTQHFSQALKLLGSSAQGAGNARSAG
jgi:N-acyl-D-aspartate/D-glutamate deacylase